MKKLLTLAEVKEKLSEVGMVLYKDNETSELQVYPKGDKRGEMSTHFTSFKFKPDQNDLEDALRTGLDMAKRLGLARKNPKISTFEEIKNELENYGIGIIKTNNYGDGPVDDKDFRHYQVYEIGNKFRGESYHSISNTDRDLKLAFEDGLKLAKKLGHKRIPYIEKRQNPKCKTIEVRRKIRILGKPRVVKVKRKICNPGLDLARMQRLLASELSQYDQRLQARQPNNHRLAHYFGAVEKAFARLDSKSTLEDMKESISRSFDPELPPVKKFLKKYT